MVAKVHFMTVLPVNDLSHIPDNKMSWTHDVYGPITPQYLNFAIQTKLKIQHENFHFQFDNTLSEGLIFSAQGKKIGTYNIVSGHLH